jgi:hypothetical protein
MVGTSQPLLVPFAQDLRQRASRHRGDLRQRVFHLQQFFNFLFTDNQRLSVSHPETL